MAVSNGQVANQTTFNNAFLSRTIDSSTSGKIALENSEEESGTQLDNAQGEINGISGFMGRPANGGVASMPLWGTDEVGLASDTLKQRIEAICERFNATLGHTHSGDAGEGGPVDAQGLNNERLYGYIYRGWPLEGITGMSVDVTAFLPVDSVASSGPEVPGIVVDVTGPNFIILKDGTGNKFGPTLRNAAGQAIYGRLTFGDSAFTLSFYVEDAPGVETPYDFTTPTNIAWYYARLESTVKSPAQFYDPIGYLVHDNYRPASATEAGVVTTGAQEFTGEKSFESANIGGLEFPGLFNVTKESTGVLDRTQTVFSWDNATRTVTLSPTGASFDTYINGRRATHFAPRSIQIPNVSGTYFVYMNAPGELFYLTEFNAALIREYVYITNLTWNAEENQLVILGDERHGLIMDWATHEYMHLTRGTVYKSGFAVGNYILGGNGSLDSHAQLSLGSGEVHDEDIQIVVTDSASPTPYSFQQTLSAIAKIPVMYRTGTGANNWKRDAATNFPIKKGTNRAYYNLNTGGTWSLAEIPNTNYGAMYIYATNDVREPIVAVMGQRYDALQNASETNQTPESLDWGTVPFQEFKLLYKVTFKTLTAYANAVAASIEAITDYRTSQSGGSAAASSSDHSLLTNRSAPNSHPDSAISVDASGFINNLDPTDTTLALVLAKIDALQASGGGALVPTGSMAAPEPVSYWVDFTSDETKPRQVIFVQGWIPTYLIEFMPFGNEPGPITVGAGVGVEPGSILGEELWIWGTSDVNTVTFSGDTAYTKLRINGPWVANQNSVLKLSWNGTVWVETGRNGI